MKRLIREAGGLVQFSLKTWTFLRREGLFTSLKLTRELLNTKSSGQSRPSKDRATNKVSSVDIIVCVHNALEDVQVCLESVLQDLGPNQRLIVVDDGSSELTRDYLLEVASGAPIVLLRNEVAKGYTMAANQGMRAAKADFFVLLNSDTVVPKGWLNDMLSICAAEPSIGLVGPLSNTASWQSIPELFDQGGEWSSNDSIRQLSPSEINGALQKFLRVPPFEVGFLNGFCLFIRREVVSDIGLFDEQGFGRGYGEENDYCLRASAAGWKLAVSAQTFVKHTQSKSYGHERRKELSNLASKTLMSKHGPHVVSSSLEKTKGAFWLELCRESTKELPKILAAVDEIKKSHSGKSILFLLPVTQPGGGAQIVIGEAQILQEAGVRVFLLNLSSNKMFFERSFPECPIPILYINSPEEITEACLGFDVVVATVNTTIPWIAPIARTFEGNLAYYVQDFEPDFYPDGSRERLQALDSYQSIPGLRIFTKTEWNQKKLQEIGAGAVALVGPSLVMDLPNDLQFSSESESDGSLRVAAMVRASTDRRQPKETLSILQQIKIAIGSSAIIEIFGSSDAELDSISNNWRSYCSNYGSIRQEEVSQLLASTNVFLDFSSYQAMGLTALQALALGNLVFGPRDGALFEIVSSSRAISLPTNDPQASLEIILSTISSGKGLHVPRMSVVVSGVHPVFSAARLADVVFG